MKFIQTFIFVVVFLNSIIHAASMRETVLISAAGGAICKIYAEKVGGDVEAFSNLNATIIQIAEKMGYTNNLQTYISDVNEIKNILQDQLLKTHGSQLSVYNDWCIKFYNGYQKGVDQASR